MQKLLRVKSIDNEEDTVDLPAIGDWVKAIVAKSSN
jgi:hypothetical protein